MITGRVTEFEVSLLPRDYPEGYLWAITVSYRGRNLWGVYWDMYCLGMDGQWDFEATPSNRTDEWLITHRFPVEQAIILARKAAERVGIHSHRDGRFMTAKDVIDSHSESITERSEVLERDDAAG